MPTFPRAYPATEHCRGFFTAAGGIVALGGMLCVYYFLKQGGAAPIAFLGALFAAAAAVWALYLILDALRARLVIYEDGLRLESFLRRRAILRKDLLGWWRTASVFVMQSGERVAGSYEYEVDEAFEEWIPLDLERAAAAKPWVALSDEHRIDAHPWARSLNIALIVSAIAVFAATFLFPRFAGVAISILVAIPGIAIAASAWTRGAIRLRRYFPLFLGCGLGLIASQGEARVPGTFTLFALAAGIGLCFYLAVQLADPLERESETELFLAAIALAIGFGAAFGLNVAWDRSQAIAARYQVASKYTTKGGKGGVQHHLLLAPGPRSEWVSQGLYDRSRPGDSICIDFHEGAFGAHWHTLRECQ